MTKNRSMRIAVLVLALALITCCFVGTTFAKYASTATGSGTLTVAKWSITSKDGSVDYTAGAALNLAKSVVTDDGTPTSDEQDANVKNTGVIAPGTAGSFSFDVANNSEVTAKYTVTFTEAFQNLPDGKDRVPLQYTTTPDEESSWKDTIASVNVAEATLAMEANATVTIYWRWAFGESVDDNPFGTADTAPVVTITATLNATQVD